jgi:hypothetical protein
MTYVLHVLCLTCSSRVSLELRAGSKAAVTAVLWVAAGWQAEARRQHEPPATANNWSEMKGVNGRFRGSPGACQGRHVKPQ